MENAMSDKLVRSQKIDGVLTAVAINNKYIFIELL